MITQLTSATIFGVHGQLVTVETDIARGLSHFTIVGLPDTRIQEAKERIRSAIKQSGFTYPYNFRITVNLAPSNIPKEGTGFDLPIALSIINKEIPLKHLDSVVIVGELALNGAIRPVPGILSRVRASYEAGKKFIIVPHECVHEASLFGDVGIIGVSHLHECVKILRSPTLIPLTNHEATSETEAPVDVDMSDIIGNEYAKRALIISAVGKHHTLLSGPPGTGKTMLARAYAGILPDLESHEVREVTEIYSSAGIELPHNKRPPLRAPHHSISAGTFLGKWRGRMFIPGEITLAHHGALFLDEFPELTRQARESLRQPLERRSIEQIYQGQPIRIPSEFTLIASQNPCRCGYAYDENRPCSCTPRERVQYEKRISGPLYDRIGMFCVVDQMKLNRFDGTKPSTQTTQELRIIITAARAFGAQEIISLPASTKSFAITASEKLRLSSRGFEHVLSVARSIAQLEFTNTITETHVTEALQYRIRTSAYN